jgi:uncharacterized repeat protein (TIGR03843 family)
VPEDERPPPPDHLTILGLGEVDVIGRLPWSSNGTFLTTCTLEDRELGAVYKPEGGERPLWDFDGGLYRREVAAYVVSDALGWGIVPETIERLDAPYGPGSLQRFVDADFSEHYFTLLEDRATHDQLRRMGAFDVVVNNADRKSGHCLLDGDGKIWGIDNGLSFHPQPKLRTVIWEFAGETIADELRADLVRLARTPPDALCDLLSEEEVHAMCTRAERLARSGKLPRPDPRTHHYPWPLV